MGLSEERDLAALGEVQDVTQPLRDLAVRYRLAVPGFRPAQAPLNLIARTAARTCWDDPQLQAGLFQGGVLTVGLLIALTVFVALSFNTFFVQFHALFFEGNSWVFRYSDTLIRLFPEQFWIDAFVLLFGGAIVEALVIGGARGGGAGACWASSASLHTPAIIRAALEALRRVMPGQV